MTPADTADWAIVQAWLNGHASDPLAFAEQPQEVTDAWRRIAARHPELT